MEISVFKALVITLYSGEAELEDCKSAIKRQVDCEIDHVIYEGLSEIDAHNVLLEKFDKESCNYDLFVKVDADTIIDHDDAFRIVYDKIYDVSSVQLKLYDFFTLSLINGLNFYNPQKNQYVKTSDKLYCDRSIIHSSKVLYSDQFDNISPVGRHCAYPNDKQAFHYGFHRGLKNRKSEYDATFKAALIHKDRARMIACEGFRQAFSIKNERKEHDYTSEKFNELFLLATKNMKNL